MKIVHSIIIVVEIRRNKFTGENFEWIKAQANEQSHFAFKGFGKDTVSHPLPKKWWLEERPKKMLLI